MRARLPCLVALSICALSLQAHAAGVDCVALELGNPEQIATVVARIAHADEAAMRKFMEGTACLDEEAKVAAGRAAGEYFDQNPREYLALAATGRADDISWLHALIFAPEQLHSDPVKRIGVQARRLESLKANADLISPEKFASIEQKFMSVIGRLEANISSQFPEPLVMTDPLAGLEFDYASVRAIPIANDIIPVSALARGERWTAFAIVRTPDAVYWVISGFSFKFSPDGSTLEGLAPDAGWIQVIHDEGKRLEVLGTPDELFTSPRIPRLVALGLCADAVATLDEMLPHGRLQNALNERLRHEPNAGLLKPLRDAFTNAGFDVKRYREIALPDVGH